jgi:hypothetical protein
MIIIIIIIIIAVIVVCTIIIISIINGNIKIIQFLILCLISFMIIFFKKTQYIF